MSHHSQEEEKVKRLLKEDDFELPMDEDFYNRLHDKIMFKLEEKYPEAKAVSPWMQAKKRLRAHWRTWAISGGSLASVFVLGFLTSAQMAKTQDQLQLIFDGEKSGQVIMSRSAERPEEVSESVLSYQTEDDFFVDVAAVSLENQDIDKLKELLGRN